MNIIESIKKIFSNHDKTYEDLLYEEYGKCNPFNKKISIYFIADSHNYIAYNEERWKELEEANRCDCCVLLGDHSAEDIDTILRIVKDVPIYGVLGNHDDWERYKNRNVINIDGKVIDINGVKIGGLSGSFKYKNSPYSPLYTHEESINIIDNMGPCDIFVSHDKPYFEESNDVVHNGLKGITKYIYKGHIPLHFHGHIHVNTETYLKNGTKSTCIYGLKKIEL